MESNGCADHHPQIIITAAAATVGAVVTVGATLGVALLRGFRRIHDKIGQTAKDIRDDNAAQFKEVREELKDMREDNAAEFKDMREDNAAEFKDMRQAIAKNAEAIAGLMGSMRVIENMLNVVLKVGMSKSRQAQADIPADTPEPQAGTARDAVTAPAVIAAATGR